MNARCRCTGFIPPATSACLSGGLRLSTCGYDDGHFGFITGKPNRLVFRLPRLAGVHLTESPRSKDKTVTETSSGYEFTATVIELEQLKVAARLWTANAIDQSG